jgi:hypothetical protein
VIQIHFPSLEKVYDFGKTYPQFPCASLFSVTRSHLLHPDVGHVICQHFLCHPGGHGKSRSFSVDFPLTKLFDAILWPLDGYIILYQAGKASLRKRISLPQFFSRVGYFVKLFLTLPNPALFAGCFIVR